MRGMTEGWCGEANWTKIGGVKIHCRIFQFLIICLLFSLWRTENCNDWMSFAKLTELEQNLAVRRTHFMRKPQPNFCPVANFSSCSAPFVPSRDSYFEDIYNTIIFKIEIPREFLWVVPGKNKRIFHNNVKIWKALKLRESVSYRLPVFACLAAFSILSINDFTDSLLSCLSILLALGRRFISCDRVK